MSMGSIEQAIKISLETNDEGAVNAVLARIREIQQEIVSLTREMAIGDVSNEKAVKGLVKWGQELKQAETLLQNLRGKQVELAAALDDSGNKYQSWAQIAAAAGDTVIQKTRAVIDSERELIAAQDALATAQQRSGGAWNSEVADAVTRVGDAEVRLAAAKRDVAAAAAVEQVAQLHSAEIDDKATVAKNRSAVATTSASDRMIHATRTVYYASQAIQDLEYGFAAIVNNLPLIANEAARAMNLSSSAAMLWASGIAIVGTAADIAWPHIKHLFEIIATEDVAADPTASLARLERRLDALKKGSWFIHIDAKEVEDLELRVAQLKQKIDAANRAALSQTEAEQAAGQRFKVAAGEFAGGTGTKTGSKNVDEAIAEAMLAHPEQFQDVKRVRDIQKLQARVARSEALLDQSTGMAAVGAARGLEVNQMALDKAIVALREHAKSIEGGAQLGKASDIAELTRIFDTNQDIFRKRGIGDEFRDILGQAGEAQVKADLDKGVEFKTPRQKAHQQAQQDFAADKKAAEAEFDAAAKSEKLRQAMNEQGVAGELEARQKFIDQPAQQVAGVLMQKKFGLQDAIDERAARMIAAGKADGDVRAAIRAFVAERVAASGVAAHLQAPAAENIFQAAMDKLEARIGAQGEVGQGARRAGARDIVGGIEQKRADDAQKAAAAAERARIAGNRRGAEAAGLIPDADARLAGQINRGQAAAERGQLKAQKQSDLEQLFVGFEQMGYSQQQANRLAESSYHLWTRGFSVIESVAMSQQQLWREHQNAIAQLNGLQRNIQRGNRARTHLNRGGGVQPGP